MSGCQINGRLWTELHNTPLPWLWKFVKLTPAGDSVMQGESYKIIQKRIVELSGMNAVTVSRECDLLRKAKLKEEQMLYTPNGATVIAITTVTFWFIIYSRIIYYPWSYYGFLSRIRIPLRNY